MPQRREPIGRETRHPSRSLLSPQLSYSGSGPRWAYEVLWPALPLVATLGVLLFRYSVELFVLGLLLVRASVDRYGGGAALTPASGLGIVVVGTTVVWLVLRSRTRRHPNSLIQAALAAYVLAAFFSIFVSLRPQTSAVEFIRLASATCVFLLVDRLLASGASRRRLLAVILASAVGPLVVAVLDLAAGKGLESKGDFDRLASTFTQSNGFSRYLMVLLIMGLASVGVWKTAATRLVVIGGCALGSVALLLTYTRASWIGAAFGLGLVIFSQRRYRLPAAITTAVLLIAIVPFLAPRFADLAGSEQGDAALSSANSLEWRLQYWEDVIELSSDSPINGIGFGSTAKVTEQQKEPHSEVVRAYAEMGVVGLFAFVFLIYAMLRTGFQAVRRTAGSARTVAVGYLAVVISFSTVSLVTNAMSQTALLWYLFALSAMAVSFVRDSAHVVGDAPIVTTRLESRWGHDSTPWDPQHG